MTAPNTLPEKDCSMTELAIPEQHSPALTVAPSAPPVVFQQESSLALWAHEADLAWNLAQKLANTSFVPTTMRGRVGDIAGCLIAGKELGLPPIAALKAMDVIQGTPALRAHAMRGLVQSRGHEVELVESTATFCRMRGRRQGAENWQEVAWPIARAQQLGLLGKPEWKKQPTTMLIARATGEICRLIASDALHGVPYNAEELRDERPRVTAVQVGAPVTAAEILSRRGPAPQEIAPAAETTEQGTETAAADGDEVVEPETYDEAAALWDDILAAADDKHGWTADQTEREFLKGSNDVPVAMAPIATLQAFLAHITGGAE